MTTNVKQLAGAVRDGADLASAWQLVQAVKPSCIDDLIFLVTPTLSIPAPVFDLLADAYHLYLKINPKEAP